ncbi:MAG: protein kinase, partial [Chthoniobacterales bacterium]
MEYLEGLPFDRILKERAPLPVLEVLAYAEQVCAALHAAHQAHVIHRDIKPENLKLRPNGKIVLLDFGLAKGSVAEMTHVTKSVWGYTKEYAPMEQIRGTG